MTLQKDMSKIQDKTFKKGKGAPGVYTKEKSITDGELKTSRNVSLSSNKSKAETIDDWDYYTKQYFSIEGLKDGNVQIHLYYEDEDTLYYQKNNSTNWTALSNGDSSLGISCGDIIRFKGNLRDTTINFKTNETAQINVFGNIMSLLYDDNFSDKTSMDTQHVPGLFKSCNGLISAKNLILPAREVSYEHYCEMFHSCINLIDAPSILPATQLDFLCYEDMFRGCTSLINAPELPATKVDVHCYEAMFYGCTSLVNAPELPATSLAEECYSSMFAGCTSLVNAPELPSTTLKGECYSYMFQGCTSLVNAPALPVTSLANSCYNNMFYGCTSLVNAPALPATELAGSCYSYMFYGCTSLANAPALPATTLANSCYNSMFQGCTSLVNAPALPSTELDIGCYLSMFQGCTSLVNAPELPATELVGGCYYSMFQGCTSLVNAPALPATELAGSCYSYMFSDCTSLKYIKCMAENFISMQGFTSDWVKGVSPNGTFVKATSNDTWTSGSDGIPDGWTVQNAGLFAGLEIAPGPLFYNGTSYSIKNNWNVNSYGDAYGKTVGSTYFSFNDMGQLFEGDSFSSGDSITNTQHPLGDWRLPTEIECNKLIGNRSGSTVNGTENAHYVVIQLTDVTHAGSNNPIGMILFPDGAVINGAEFEEFDVPDVWTTLSLSELNEYLNQGCAFIPCDGGRFSNWSGGGYFGHVLSSRKDIDGAIWFLEIEPNNIVESIGVLDRDFVYVTVYLVR